MPLPTTHLGQTGLTVTRMGLGLAALGRPGYINLGHGEDLAYNYVVEAMEHRTHEMLDLAYKEGIRYFDAARSYGRAEQFLLSWLKKRQIDPEEVTVASKWGYTYTAGWEVEAGQHEVKDHSIEVLQRQWRESKVLQPHLKIYQIHSATFESGVLENKEVLSFLAHLKEKDVRIGLTLSGPDQVDVLETAMLVRVDGIHLFDVAQATFNVLEQSAGPVLAAAAEAGLGIIVKEALANGRLTRRNQDPGFSRRKMFLEGMAKSYKAGIDAVALAFVLAQPWAHVVLSGAAIQNHLLDNLKAFHIHLDPRTMQELRDMIMDPKEYWVQRNDLKWN